MQADALRLLPMSLRSIGGKEPPFHGAFDCVFFFLFCQMVANSSNSRWNAYGSICCYMCSLVLGNMGVGRCKQRKKTEIQKNLGFSLLGYPDSNQKRQDQNLQCYHYTIPQFCCASLSTATVFLNCECKGTEFFWNHQIFCGFFLKNMRFSSILHKKTQKKSFYGAYSTEIVYLCRQRNHIL